MPHNALRTHTHTSRKSTPMAPVILARTLHRSTPPQHRTTEIGRPEHTMGPAELVATVRLAMLRSTLPQCSATPYTPSTVYTPYDSQGAAESTNSSSTTDDPHVLTAQTAKTIQHPSEMKETPRDLSGGSGRNEWVADPGASYHVTGDPTGGCLTVSPPQEVRRG